ncbi:glycosyltransferase [Fundicoccus culcitae]|uniref:Glycosyltransferase n=1 Tax=Fundicoccus culcitae TaxID=2969821 RepID=A0ABY5P990_9LACT|nr:glycosyltransferase [Fundicoccus culcitae]UUX35239.1 glycosyltransferase [Fundicoccus culcitae]
MKLSVIIPVYNVEDYIEKCVDSVINQSYKDLEILLINDGSTDNSGKICDELQNKYKKVRVFHKENEGLSETRNYGIRKSKGDYIAFLDSDDYIYTDAYKNLMSVLLETKVDIVIGSLVKYIPENDIYVQKQKKFFSKQGKIISGQEYLTMTIKENIYSAVAVKGIYKKSLINSNNIFFEKGLLHEDELWSPQILIKAKKVIDTGFIFYVHVSREGSITNKKNKTKNSNDLIRIVYELEKIYNSKLNREDSRYLRNYLVNLYLYALNIGGFLTKESNFNIDKKFLYRNSNSIRNLIKVTILSINVDLYKKLSGIH